MAKNNVGFAVSLLSLGALRLCAGKLTLGATLGTYPGLDTATYTCANTPSGLVSASFSDDGKMTFGFQLSELPLSTTGGIHIHVGTTCDDADDVGGHYWTPETDDDPWTCTWSSDSDGYDWSTIQLETGYDYDENNGHAVVWHDADGNRCGCGLLTPMQPTLTAKIKPYPDYTGNIEAKGTVSVQMMEDNTHMQYGFDLQNLEADETGGVHIHAGTTCEIEAGEDADTVVGGHYWTPDTAVDVWTAVTWASDSKKSASSSIILDSGYTYEEIVGHAVVVHDSDGNRVGCGILAAADDEKRGGSRLYSLIGGLNKKLQASASTFQLAGLASVSVAAILAVVAFRVKKARAVKPVPYIATEATDSEEGGLLY